MREEDLITRRRVPTPPGPSASGTPRSGRRPGPATVVQPRADGERHGRTRTSSTTSAGTWRPASATATSTAAGCASRPRSTPGCRPRPRPRWPRPSTAPPRRSRCRWSASSPRPGYVRALVGGRDFEASQVNLALGGSRGHAAGLVVQAVRAGHRPRARHRARDDVRRRAVLVAFPGCDPTVHDLQLRLRRTTASDDPADGHRTTRSTRSSPSSSTRWARRRWPSWPTASACPPIDPEPSPTASRSPSAPTRCRRWTWPRATPRSPTGACAGRHADPAGARPPRAASWRTTRAPEGEAGHRPGRGRHRDRRPPGRDRRRHRRSRRHRPAGGRQDRHRPGLPGRLVRRATRPSSRPRCGWATPTCPGPSSGIKGVGSVTGGSFPAETWAGFMRAALAGLPVVGVRRARARCPTSMPAGRRRSACTGAERRPHRPRPSPRRRRPATRCRRRRSPTTAAGLHTRSGPLTGRKGDDDETT